MAWPVMIQDGSGQPVSGAVFMVSYANREEKGSDAMSPRTSCWTSSAARSTPRL
jgi:hypothetical protein